MNLLLGGIGTCMAFFGIFMNLYVIIVLLLNKKARTSSEWILLHLSWCGLGASFFNLCLISPSIFLARWLTSTGSMCSVVGASVLTLQLLTVWSICALSADRCAAIASPLRYTQLVTGRRVAIYFLIIWMLSIGTAMTAFIVSSMREQPNFQSIPKNNDNHSEIGNKITLNESESHLYSNSNSYIVFNAGGKSANISDTNLTVLPIMSAPSLPNNSASALLDLPNNPKLSAGVNRLESNSTHSSFSSPTVANMIFDMEKGNSLDRTVRREWIQQDGTSSSSSSTFEDIENTNHDMTTVASVSNTGFTFIAGENDNLVVAKMDNHSFNKSFGSLEFRKAMGLCLPRVYFTSLPSVLWVTEWVFVILVAPLCTILVCDLVVLSIARKQRHRIVMALYQITLSAQATVVRSKGATPPQLWLNRSIPARSRACRAVLEDISSLILIHLPLILILVFEMIADDHHAPVLLHVVGSVSLFLSPSFTALLYGIRARSLRAAYKSYIRKRMTNNTLQHEIQQRLSPVDGGSPRPSTGAKSFRSCTPSPASSPIQTPRRLSTNDLRPPPMHFPMSTSPLLPFPSASTNMINNNLDSHHHNNQNSYHLNKDFNEETSFLGGNFEKPRKIRSFLHLPTQHDMQEFWSGLRRPNRSPTIIITHEIRLKDSANSSYDSKSVSSSPTAEQRL